MENVFTTKGNPDDKHVAFALTCLKGYPCDLSTVAISMNRTMSWIGHQWGGNEQHMNDKFVPLNYERKMY